MAPQVKSAILERLLELEVDPSYYKLPDEFTLDEDICSWMHDMEGYCNLKYYTIEQKKEKICQGLSNEVKRIVDWNNLVIEVTDYRQLKRVLIERIEEYQCEVLLKEVDIGEQKTESNYHLY